MTQVDILNILRSEQIRILAREYGISHLSLFGSYARGTARPDSDIDLLYERAPGARLSLFRLLDLKKELETQLQRSIDIVTREAIHPRLRESILEDITPIF
jgi:uncharacterized protein